MKSWLGICAIVVAVLAGGLALVTVAPAPPAAAVEDFVLSHDSVTLRPPGDWSMCEASVASDNPTFQYLRRFQLADHGVPTGRFALRTLSFGVAKVFKAGFAEVRVYGIDAEEDDGTMSLTDLSLLEVQRPFIGFDDRDSVVELSSAVSLVDASQQDLVLSVGGGSTGQNAFFAIGSGVEEEAEPSYIVAPYCGVDDARDTDDVVNLRSDPVIFGSGATVDPFVHRPPPVTTPEDLDGDGAPNADDDCPRDYVIPGNGSDKHPGCTLIDVVASAAYDSGQISGFVDPAAKYSPNDPYQDAPPEAFIDVCLIPTMVIVWELEDSDHDASTPMERTRALGTAMSGVGGAYELSVGDLPLGTHYAAVVTDTLLPSVSCEGVDDSKLEPRTVAAAVPRSVTADYHPGGRITGQVTVLDPPSELPQACRSFDVDGIGVVGPLVEVYQRTGDGDERIGMTYADPDGSFSVPFDPVPPPGTQLIARAPLMDAELDGARCLDAESAPVRAYDDDDGDDVPDDVDRCTDIWGQTGGSYPGCPVVERSVTASHEGGVLTGNVLVESHVSGSPCGTSNRLTVERLLGDGNAEPLAETTVSGQDGPFEIEVDISEGARLRVTADAYFDTGIAHCLTATSVFVAGDRDGDGVLNSVDACDDVDGPPAAGPRSGCPELVRVVASSYAAGVVTGVVRFTDALVPRTACAGEAQSRVEVWRQLSDDEFDVVLVEGGHYTPEDGRFAIELDEELPVGAVYRIYVRDGVDPLAGYCGSVFSEAFTVDVDSDGDGVDDSVDACDDVDGPAASGPRSGCPELVRVVTSSSYAAGVVKGVVRFTDALVPRTACAGEAQSRVEVWRQLSDDEFDVELVKGGHYTPEDGRFAIELDEELPVGAVYRIHVRDGVDPMAGYCGSVFSQAYTVSLPATDTDGDTVTDDLDACDHLDGDPDEDPAFSGCPTLERTVTAHYFHGTITGAVTSAIPGACLQAQAVSIVRVPATGDGVDLTTKADGSYSKELGLPAETRFVVTAPRVLDASGKGICGLAESQIVEVPRQEPGEPPGDGDGDEVADDVDACPGVQGPAGGQHPGCPTLTRTVTASYAGGVITGQVSVLGPHSAPAGTCLTTDVRAFNVRDGVPVRVGATTTTSATGSFSIALGGGLAAGSTYFVTTDRYLHGDAAVCGAAESATSQVPTAIDPPRGTVPEAGQLAPVLSRVKLTKRVIHAAGSRLKPRATKVRLSLNVAATVLVKVKGTAKATGKPTGGVTGKKVLAKLTTTLGPGGSSIKLTGRLGKKRLPPGVYRVSVRATNALGATTAVAGKLRISP